MPIGAVALKPAVNKTGWPGGSVRILGFPATSLSFCFLLKKKTKKTELPNDDLERGQCYISARDNWG